MSSGSLCHLSEAQQNVGLLRALEWLIPEPANSTQVRVGDGRGTSPAPVSVIVGAAPLGTLANDRNFRAFPNAESPRFLYPAGVPFRRFSALLRPRSHSLTKTVASKVLTSVPRLVEKRSVPVVVTTEEESTLSRLVQEFAEPENTAIYVGYRDGIPRPTIWGFDERGVIRTIAKYASGAREQHSLQKEYQILKSLNDLSRFVGRVPSPRAFEHGHLGSMLVTDAFDGLPGPSTINDAVEQWLMDCIVGPEIAAGASSILQSLTSQAVEQGGIVLAAFAPAYEQLRNTIVPATIVHGDFTPWNIFVDAGTVRVFDWETAILDGIPEWDRVFYIFRNGLLAHAWSPDRLVKEVRLRARQGSGFYDASEWRAVLTISLVNLLVTESQVGNATDTLESVLDEFIKSWWG